MLLTITWVVVLLIAIILEISIKIEMKKIKKISSFKDVDNFFNLLDVCEDIEKDALEIKNNTERREFFTVNDYIIKKEKFEEMSEILRRINGRENKEKN